MNDYPIYNAPLPTNANSNPAKRKYPFNQLEPGQSFFVGIQEGKRLSTMKSLCFYHSRHGKQFRAAMTDDGTYIQVWRET